MGHTTTLRPRQRKLVQLLRILVAVRFHFNFTFAHILWMQFDGSLRPPQDTGFPSCSGRIGTAAASCTIVDDNEIGLKALFGDTVLSSRHLLDCESSWLGGKAFASGSVENSAGAEYEGLLLGLEKAVDLVQDHRKIDKILIQGDCKTVLDQMADSARPRKLRSHFLQAQEKLHPIQRSGVEIIYEHIPREHNQLCDGLCTIVGSNILEPAAWDKVVARIERGDDLLGALVTIVGAESLIPYSKRPFLYGELVHRANQLKDYEALVQLGQVMEEEAKTIWSSAGTSAEHAKQLQVEGVLCQIQGLQGLPSKKSQKQAVAKERMNRYLLQQHEKSASPSHDWSLLTARNNGNDDTRITHHELQPMWEAWLDKAKASLQWQQQWCEWSEIEPQRHAQHSEKSLPRNSC